MKIEKMNFKKIFIIYIIAAIVAGIASIGFLTYQFRDKIIFSYEYNKLCDKIVHNKKSSMNFVKSELSSIANKSTDIADILILDNDNTITFSVKRSALAKNGSLDLICSNNMGRRFFVDRSNPNVYYRFVDNDDLLLSKSLIENDKQIFRDHRNKYFYEENFNYKKVYLLSYILDKTNGNKIYFVYDIKPVQNGKLYIKTVCALAMLFFMLYWILVALWVYQNALKSKLNATIWGIITLFTNLAGLFVYIIYKQNNQTCFKCGAVQGNSNMYCTFCGSKLKQTCEKCGSPISLADNYCRKCGSEICR